LKLADFYSTPDDSVVSAVLYSNLLLASNGISVTRYFLSNT